jgi:hypothetical protein
MMRDEHPLPEEFFRTNSAEEEKKRADLPDFPAAAWRGIFDDYRKANERATEASDVFHFGSLWPRAAASLGRRVYFSLGMKIYPSVFVVNYGPTGDRKTTATRQATELGNGIKVISGGGSGEAWPTHSADSRPARARSSTPRSCLKSCGRTMGRLYAAAHVDADVRLSGALRNEFSQGRRRAGTSDAESARRRNSGMVLA